MNCSHEECNNKATCGFGWGKSKGNIPVCLECMKIYKEHVKAREKYFK